MNAVHNVQNFRQIALHRSIWAFVLEQRSSHGAPWIIQRGSLTKRCFEAPSSLDALSRKRPPLHDLRVDFYACFSAQWPIFLCTCWTCLDFSAAPVLAQGGIGSIGLLGRSRNSRWKVAAWQRELSIQNGHFGFLVLGDFEFNC